MLSETVSATAPAAGWRAAASASVVRWMVRGAWAVVDQGVFGVSNLMINVLMARGLPASHYGAFTVAYSLFLFLGTVHTALVSDPMIVYGSGKYRDHLPSYVGVLLRGHWLLAAGASVAMVAGGGVLLTIGHHALGTALFCLAAANPFMLLLWLMRRVCYIEVDSRLAAAGSLLYMALVLTGMFALTHTGRLSVLSAFALMGGGSLLASLCIRARLPFAVERHVSSSFRRTVARDHRAYGRWAVGTGILSGATLYLAYLVLPLARGGLERTAALRALSNLVLPALQSIWVLAALAVPKLVRVRHTDAFRVLVRHLVAMNVAGAALYWACLGLFHQSIIGAVYGHRYDSDAELLWLLGLFPIVVAAVSTLEGALRALERVDAIFRAYLVAAVCTGAIGVPLMLAWNVRGAIVALLLAYILALVSLVGSLRRAMLST